jgi:hypothetical protein
MIGETKYPHARTRDRESGTAPSEWKIGGTRSSAREKHEEQASDLELKSKSKRGKTAAHRDVKVNFFIENQQDYNRFALLPFLDY